MLGSNRFAEQTNARKASGAIFQRLLFALFDSKPMNKLVTSRADVGGRETLGGTFARVRCGA